MALTVELQVNNSTVATARYVTWAPSLCRVRVTNPSGTTTPTVSVKLSSVSAANGGAVVFRSGSTGAFASTLTLSVPINGTSVTFFAAGKLGQPSTNDGDVTIEARVGTTLVGSVKLMVRIRKNAARLTTGERDRFISALARLNNQGQGRFVDFRDMHNTATNVLTQSHGIPGFLPWHRAYLLDLERELQAIDRSVTLPYWRFDQAAPSIFTREFLGVANSTGTLQFSSTNPLQFWRTDNMPGINRSPQFNTNNAPPGLLNEAQTIALSSAYTSFRRLMEGNPHGFAHTSFDGFIFNPATAPRDPLFFLLHCNVDRLWAKWQRQLGRFDPAVASSYDNSSTRVGQRLADTMWPWNGITGGTRPATAPGGALAVSQIVAAPGASPRVSDTLDYHGAIAAAARLGFDYDDVPF